MRVNQAQIVRDYLIKLQAQITQALYDLDGTPFVVDPWKKPEGEMLQGDGITQILEGGPVFERRSENGVEANAFFANLKTKKKK
jgi:coproporphyrinogen III oxidase